MVIVEYIEISLLHCVLVWWLCEWVSRVWLLNLYRASWIQWAPRATLDSESDAHQFFFSSFLQCTNIGTNLVNARARANVPACVHTISICCKHLNCYIVGVYLRKIFTLRLTFIDAGFFIKLKPDNPWWFQKEYINKCYVHVLWIFLLNFMDNLQK